jgi:nucleotide-binding universal stress UspA family protein
VARIVVGVDGSAHADRALRWAAAEAQLRAAEVELVHSYVMPLHRPPLGTSSRALAEATMDQTVARNREALGQVKWSTTLVPVLGSSYAHALMEAGDEADMVVLGSRGLGGFAELILGSTSCRTAGHAPCPVAVIRGEGEIPGRDGGRAIVVGVDGSRAARRALRWALDEAELRAAPLTVVHGYAAPTALRLSGAAHDRQRAQMRSAARERASGLVERALATVGVPSGVQVDRILAAGSPADALLQAADSAALVVVGTRGYGALGRMVMGSVSHHVLTHAHGPVVVAP